MPLGVDAQAYLLTGASAHAAAAGTLAAIGWGEPRRLGTFDREGNLIAAGPPADYYQIRLSRDGRKAAVSLIDRRTGVGALWTLDVARNTLTRASFENIDHDSPTWSPDGRQIVFASDVGGPPHLYIHDVGTGKIEPLLPAGNIQFPDEWTADRIFYQEVRPETRTDIMTLSLKDKTPRVWLSTPFGEFDSRVSPDGQWVAFISDLSGMRELYAAHIDRPREAVRLTTGGVRQIRWSRDGRELYFLRGTRDLYALPMKVEGDSIAAAEPVHLFTTTSTIQSYDVDPSGRFLVSQLAGGDVIPLTVVLNWQAQLEAAK